MRFERRLLWTLAMLAALWGTSCGGRAARPSDNPPGDGADAGLVLNERSPALRYDGSLVFRRGSP